LKYLAMVWDAAGFISLMISSAFWFKNWFIASPEDRPDRDMCKALVIGRINFCFCLYRQMAVWLIAGSFNDIFSTVVVMWYRMIGWLWPTDWREWGRKRHLSKQCASNLIGDGGKPRKPSGGIAGFLA
jgi:hypothetical protein